MLIDPLYSSISRQLKRMVRQVRCIMTKHTQLQRNVEDLRAEVRELESRYRYLSEYSFPQKREDEFEE